MWPTPTPLPPMPTPEFLSNVDVEQIGQDFATGLVQGFNFFDAQDFAGLVWFVLLGLIILFGLMSIRKHLEGRNGG